MTALPTTLDSLKRVAASLPVEQQVTLIQHLASGRAFGGFDVRDTDALDRALANMAACAVEDRVAENDRLHGREAA